MRRGLIESAGVAGALLLVTAAKVQAATSLQVVSDWQHQEVGGAMVLEAGAWSRDAGRVVVVVKTMQPQRTPPVEREALVFGEGKGFLASVALDGATAAASAGSPPTGAWPALLQALGRPGPPPAQAQAPRPGEGAAASAALSAGLLGEGGRQQLEGMASGADGSLVVFGERDRTPFVSRIDPQGEASWAQPLPGLAGGLVAAAVPERDGGTYLATVAAAGGVPGEGATSIRVVRLDPRGKIAGDRQLPGDACALVAAEEGVALLVSGKGGWSLMRLDPKLDLVAQLPLALDLHGLWRIAAAPAGGGRIALLDMDGLKPRLSVVDASGKLLLRQTLDQPGLLPSPAMQLIAGPPGTLYAVLPARPVKDAGGAVRVGVRVLELQLSY